MNFEFDKSYTSLDLARKIAHEKKSILIYCYWTDYDPYSRYPHCDSFVFYKFTSIIDFIEYIVRHIKYAIGAKKYELENYLSVDDFNICLDDGFSLICENFPSDLKFEPNAMEKMIVDKFEKYE